MSVTVDEETFWLGDWRVEPQLNRIVRGEEIVKIDPRNMKVLQLLATRPGQVFSQAEIEESVWSDVIVTSNSVYQSIAQLRRALADDKRASRYVETIPRKGYRAVAQIRRSSPTQRPSLSAGQLWLSGIARLRSHRLLLCSGLCLVLLAIYGIASGRLQRAPTQLASLIRLDDAKDLTSSKTSSDHPLTTIINKTSPRLLEDLAYTALAQGDWKDAHDYFQQALDIERKRVGNQHQVVGRLLSELSIVAIWRYDYDAAEAYARDALAALEHLPATHHERIVATRQLGYTLFESGKFDEAEVHLLRALELSRQTFEDTEWNTTAVLLYDLAMLRFSQGRVDEAEHLVRESLKLLHEIFDDETLISNASMALGLILVAQGRYQEAKVEAENTLALLHSRFAEDHPYIIAARDLLGKSLVGLGEYVAAEDILRRNVELWQEAEGMTQRAAASLSVLGEALLGQGRIAEAAQCLTLASKEIDGTSMAREERQWFREHKERLDKLQMIREQLSGERAQLAEVEAM